MCGYVTKHPEALGSSPYGSALCPQSQNRSRRSYDPFFFLNVMLHISGTSAQRTAGRLQLFVLLSRGWTPPCLPQAFYEHKYVLLWLFLFYFVGFYLFIYSILLVFHSALFDVFLNAYFLCPVLFAALYFAECLTIKNPTERWHGLWEKTKAN